MGKAHFSARNYVQKSVPAKEHFMKRVDALNNGLI